MANKGKDFEARFRKNWLETVRDSFCYRIPDQMSGFKGSSNVGDFICYKHPYMYIFDCKTKKGNTLPFSDIRQYDKMLEYKNILGVHVGIICWFYEKDLVVYIPIRTLEKIKNEDKKSFNIKMLEDENYECFSIPGKKLRTFIDTDYSKLVGYCHG